MPKGGRQPGAGRPVFDGPPDVELAVGKEAEVPTNLSRVFGHPPLQEASSAGGELPKGFMLRIMRDESQPLPLRADMAKAVAPYCHPRLNAIEHTGEDGGPLIVILNETNSKL
jgi:hypothetical protein